MSSPEWTLCGGTVHKATSGAGAVGTSVEEGIVEAAEFGGEESFKKGGGASGYGDSS